MTDPDATARERLHLVRTLARRVAMRTPRTVVEFDDLVGAGMLGLADALRRHDPTAGEFGPYATTRILGEIRDAVRARLRHHPYRYGLVAHPLTADVLRDDAPARPYTQPDTSLDDRDQVAAILAALPTDLADALTRRYLYADPVDSIAAYARVSRHTIWHRLRRARHMAQKLPFRQVSPCRSGKCGV